MSPRIRLSQSASHAAVHAALYSASVDERATVGCFLLSQDITPEASMKQYPVVDRLLSLSPAQSESQNPLSCPPEV